MKTADQILDNVMCCTIEEDAEDLKENYYYRHNDVVKAIEQAQKEAYNQALDDAYLLGKVSYELIQSGHSPIYEYRIDKESILKLKK